MRPLRRNRKGRALFRGDDMLGFWDYLPESKFCRRCKTRKPLTEFYTRKDIPTGKKAWCKPCDRAYARLMHNNRTRREGYNAVRPLRRHLRELYIAQRGICNGCEAWLPMRQYEIDHIVPLADGGGDEIANLQLLCHPCNASKQDNDMAFLKAQLRDTGVI